jgi:hypothetical protein
MRKIFFIGSNKTGTSTFHQTLLNSGIKSRHNPRWGSRSRDHDKNYFLGWDAFSDGAGNVDLHWLNNTFDGFFVLNTRNVKDWATSRWNHAQRNKSNSAYRRRKPHGFLHNDKKDVVNWILHRNIYHQRAVDYFKGRENFLILSITTDSNKAIFNKLQKAAGQKLKALKNSNVTKNKESYNKNPKPVLEALIALGIKKEDHNKIILDIG